MRKSQVAEKYVKVVQDMYENSVTTVRCAVGMTEGLKVEVELHQGLALSPFLFAMVMDRLTDEVRQESPWNMMFADDIVICNESKKTGGDMHLREEEWKSVKARLSTCMWMRSDGETVLLQRVEIPKVKEFRYMGSIVQCNLGCGSEVKRRVQAGWNNWRRVSGVICDRRLSACAKGKVCKTVVRPAVLYGLECH